MLVYEPEAAALYCRFQNMQNISNAKDESYLSKKKMLVFDMGGKQALFKLLIGFFFFLTRYVKAIENLRFIKRIKTYSTNLHDSSYSFV